jgi:poly(glycerol-phosphate) alpha-glucosyltransferase
MNVLESSAPDIIHSHGIWTYCSIACHLYASRRKIPYIISPHGMLDPWALNNSYWKKKIAYYLYERSHLQDAQCVRALCFSEKESFRKVGLKQPICIIPNGVDLPIEEKHEGSLNQGKKGIKTLLFLGRIHPKKGLPNALRAFAKLINDRRSKSSSLGWQFVIAGWEEGGHEEDLKKLCEELGLLWSDFRHSSIDPDAHNLTLGSDVHFHGPAYGKAKDTLFRDASAFILSSYSEGVPMSVLEAMAYEIPVVMTPECNLPKAFAINAALKVETDVESIVCGMNTLFSMKDADLMSMGARGRRLVEENFSWKKMATQMAAVYNWVLGGGEMPDCVCS